MKEQHPLRNLFFILIGLTIFGIFGFYLLGEDLWHSFYTTVIILLSHFKHGVDEPVIEQMLTIILIIGSYLILAYIIKGSAEFLFGGEYKERRRIKKMNKKISELEGHYIVAGFGRVGKQVAQELADEGVDFVIVDRSPLEIKDAEKNNYLFIEGDPIKEDVLVKAGIKKAKSLLAALGDDTDNLFLTLTAKSLNPNLYIVSRASEQENVSKLEKAGADKVSLPYQIGGFHMAAIALRPAVVDFLDVIIDGKHTELQVEEILIERGSPLIGQKISAAISREKTGTSVLAINKKDGKSSINPPGDEIIERDDQLILMGTKENLVSILKELS